MFVNSFGWLVCALTWPLTFSLRIVEFESNDAKIFYSRKSTAQDVSTVDVEAASRVLFSSNEHKALGDLSWDSFQDAAPGAIKDWATRNGIEEDGEIISKLSVKQVTKQIRIDSMVLDEGERENEGMLSFGDFTFLAGDFFADMKHGGNLEEPAGTDFMQMDPLKPWLDIKKGYNKKFGIEVPGLVRAVRGFAAKGANYDSGSMINFLAESGLYVSLTAGRYKELAFTNHNHFGVLARREYVRYHDLAVNRAYEAGKSNVAEALMNAFEIEAMGSHYLSDFFSAGHVRVPRTQLQAVCGDDKAGGLLKGSSLESKMPGGVPVAGYLTKMMHDEDGKLGVDLNDIGRDTWTAYGDDMYFSEHGKKNKDKVIQGLVGGLKSILCAYLEGLSGKLLGDHSAVVPKISPIQRFAPLFKLDSPKKPGSNISLVMRTTQADAQQPAYILIDKDCSGISVKCRTCKAAIKNAEKAKTSAKAIGEGTSLSSRQKGFLKVRSLRNKAASPQDEKQTK